MPIKSPDSMVHACIAWFLSGILIGFAVAIVIQTWRFAV